MKQILGRLEALGFVERLEHPEHGWVLQAYLTERGDQLRRECTRLVVAVEERMVSVLSEEERRRLFEAVRTCTDALRGDAQA